MRKKSSNGSFIALMLVSALLYSCISNEGKHHRAGKLEQHGETAYVCPMHPEVTGNQPGVCPECNMDLEPVMNRTLVQATLTNKQVLSRQSTVRLSPQDGTQTLKAEGYIDLDRSRHQSVSARFGGRIEKLYVKYDLQFVRKGEKVMELYSPGLSTMQEEHLFLIESGAEKSLIEKSREKLLLLGMTADQLNELETSGKVGATVSVYSPASGYVFFDGEKANDQKTDGTYPMSDMGMGESNESEKQYPSSPSQIRAGTYVNVGQTLFSVNDLQSVWAIVSVPNETYSSLREHQTVKISSELFPAKPITGKIAWIEKIFEDENQRFARVRIPLSNTDRSLKINSFITAEMATGNTGHLRVPSSAVYRKGLSSVVWVKTGTTEMGTGIFQPRGVTAGTGSDGWVSIFGGLSPDAEIAKEAGLMADSETLLNGN